LPGWKSGAEPGPYRRRPPRPFFARFRDDRRALFLAEDLRPPELFRALFRVERPALFLADFLLLFLADFLELLREDFLADLRADDFLLDFLADVRRDDPGVRLPADSPKSSYEEGVEAGEGAGVFSIGSGSIHPEPDQPISI
jgi:hypothetical protein